MKKVLHFSFLTFALIISSQSPATAGELLFGKDNEWVVFQGPILLEEVDQILSQLEDKKPKLILLNSTTVFAVSTYSYVDFKPLEIDCSNNTILKS